MTAVETLITENLDIWASAIRYKSNAGRGRSKKTELYGIQKLRALILDLAVSGLLVSQDPNDESAEKLLVKITAEKERLAKEGKIKKARNSEVAAVTPEEALPLGWSYCTLSDISEIVRGITFPASEKSTTLEEGRVACLRTSNVQEHIEWDDLLYIREEFVKREDQYILQNDIVMSMANSRELVGKVAAISSMPESKITFGGFLGVIRPIIADSRFITCLLRSPKIRQELIESASQTTNIANISLAKLKPLILALPPLKEQHRIVAKVDELMALCDQLEQQTEASIAAHQTLVETLLGALTNAPVHASFQQAWQRIAEHFDTLFTTEHSIDQLKQTILQLAVMGNLVSQDPNDMPAHELYQRLSSKRDRALRATEEEDGESRTMIRKLKKLKAADAPFELPPSWKCIQLIQICRVLVDCHNKTAPYRDAGIPIIRTTNVRNREFLENNLKYVDQDTYNYWSRRCPPEPGDIIFTREAPMGEALIIPEGAKWCLGQRTMLIRPMHEFVSNEYLLLALTEPNLLERASENAVGLTVKHLRVGDVESLSIPLPPLNEQHRIVKRVNDLLAICNQITALLQCSQANQTLLSNVLARRALGA